MKLPIGLTVQCRMVNPEWLDYFRAAHSNHPDFAGRYGKGQRTPEPYI